MWQKTLRLCHKCFVVRPELHLQDRPSIFIIFHDLHPTTSFKIVKNRFTFRLDNEIDDRLDEEIVDFEPYEA
jgi:hypothetical protein